MRIDEPSAGSVSAVSSLKEIVTVVMALTTTNTLILLLTSGNYSSVRSLGSLPAEETVFSGLIILTIFRFYHGNIRHLDSVYGQREQMEHVVKPAPRGGVGIDFFVILTQSILFAVMSFYASNPEQLLVLFIVLLASDVTWVLVVQQPSADHAGFAHQRRWMLNNFIALLVLVVILAAYAIPGVAHHDDKLVYAGGAIMLANAILDFIINWSFYFPDVHQERSDGSAGRTIFLAAPLTQTLDSSGKVAPAYREWLEGLINALERAGHKVVSAHKREQWGERIDSPATALKTDLRDLGQSHAVVAHVGDPPSPGVQFELGFATSLGIPILLLLEKERPRPYLNPALPAVTPTDILELARDDQSHKRVVHALSHLLSAEARSNGRQGEGADDISA
jgi:nucleoside 2-deoxyribosyltransferase